MPPSEPQLREDAVCLLCHIIHPWPAGWVGLQAPHDQLPAWVGDTWAGVASLLWACGAGKNTPWQQHRKERTEWAAQRTQTSTEGPPLDRHSSPVPLALT